MRSSARRAARGRRVFAAMSGMTSERERAEEARKLIDWGMKAFDKKQLFADGEVVGEASVFGGEKGGVALKAKGPVSILVPITNRDKMIARIVYEGPVVAPVEAGTPVGALKIWIGDTLSQETPLFAAERRRRRRAAPARHRRGRGAAGRLDAVGRELS